MRQWMKIALALVVSLSFSDDAFAGKKKKGGDATDTKTEEPAEKGAGPVAAFEIGLTNIADVDNVFQQAIDPLNNLRNTRNAINSLNTNLITALGLTEGTPVKDALADLKTKANGAITLAMDEKGMPKLTPADAAPENVTNAVNALNQGVADVMAAVENLAQLPSQMKEVAAAAGAISPDSLIKSGVKPLEAPKMMKTVSSNIKMLGEAPNELAAIKTELEALINDIKSTFSA